ncbi:hypothetical protein GF366_00950 [Candidatus Peregrinibacteria bacterium]|nr:hypothetical protein [Candidatus Peregrinibacteria bacterium]
MKRICRLTGEEFEITPQEIEFMEKKMELPLPVYSPKVREIGRMGFRNDRNLYMRNCDATGERILSVYDQSHPFPVYKYDYWITDEWFPPEIDFDPDKDFFEQFAELDRITPHVNLFNPYNENCDYVNAAEKNKNCYMHILSDRCEDCYYTHAVFACRDCIDSAYTINSELCYECTDCRNCYHCRMCFLCDNSSDLSFCFECRGCKNCFFCSGLKNQRYCFENKQLSKEEYEAKITEIDFENYDVFDEYKKRFLEEMVEGKPYRRMINNENSDGNFLINTKKCHRCFDLEDAEDCFYVRVGSNNIKDVEHSYAIVDGSQLICGNISTTESYNCHNVIGCWTTKDSFYSLFLQGCSNCIGCISLRRKKYCILNKQYSEEEYQKLKAQIVEKMGDYYGSPFPLKLAPFTYQDSSYSDYYDMSREEVEKLGWKYGQKKEIEEKAFKIIDPEKKLLRKIGSPLPRKHYELRFLERVKYRKEAEKLME